MLIWLPIGYLFGGLTFLGMIVVYFFMPEVRLAQLTDKYNLADDADTRPKDEQLKRWTSYMSEEFPHESSTSPRRTTRKHNGWGLLDEV